MKACGFEKKATMEKQLAYFAYAEETLTLSSDQSSELSDQKYTRFETIS